MTVVKFDPEKYVVVDTLTGEELPMETLINKASSEYWEKAYSERIADYIELAGGSSTRVLAYLIREKDTKNLIIGTVRGIAEECKVSTKVVTKLFKTLQEDKFLKKVSNGVYMLSPYLLRHGSSIQGAMLLRIWEK